MNRPSGNCEFAKCTSSSLRIFTYSTRLSGPKYMLNDALRAQQKRNLLVTLLLSQGVPMLLAGDELGHTQQGNNNAYCQDNEISWLDWDNPGYHRALTSLVQKVIALRRSHPVFRRRNFFQGRAIKGVGVKDILWLRPDGREMTDEEWNQANAKTLGVFLSGSAVDELDERGQPLTDENFLLLMNAYHEEVAFSLPTAASGMLWDVAIDTSSTGQGSDFPREPGTTYPLQPRSLAVLIELQPRSPSSGSPE